ncbi:MAG: DUF1670 domain-containing protein [Candidatus Methanoperedens sp.]|nr:DUF1670 domain-containing protein [Candidatus Methanoperedens sp.]
MNLKLTKRKYESAKERFTEPALMNFLKTEFPSLGGEKVRELFVKELMNILERFYYSKDKIKSGQMRWLAISKDTRPTCDNPIFVPVTLTVVSEVDIEKYCNCVNREEIVQDIIARLLTETYDQGGLLSMRDVSLILCYGDSYLSDLRQRYEKRKNTILHFTGYDMDMGTAISHKTVIIRKVYQEKKEPLQVARETNPRPDAVERYCLDFNKVKWCFENGMSKQEITIVTGMKSHLIDEYLEIIKEINASIEK